MQKKYKVIIVGGGASGLMCAIELLSGAFALTGEQIAILERNDRVGKKLIATGNGQGNLSNTNFSADFFHGEKGFLRVFVQETEQLDLLSYLKKLGIPLVANEDGKIYPLSKQANSVLDIMRAFLSNKGCQIFTDTRVEKIKKEGELFSIATSNDKFLAESVVLATGGKSAKQFGTDGTAYSLARSFGHELTPLYPSLVQLKTELDNIRGLKGLKETVKLTAFDGDVELKSSIGELLFTEYGVSGNAVFQISGRLTDAKKPKIKVEFLPELAQEEIEELLIYREELGYLDGELFLSGILNKRIGQSVIKTVKNATPKEVAKALKGFWLNVIGDLGFNYSQVTKGGISTAKINPFTLESKLSRNLYLIGELLDVDGDCGGYNLTFAFSTGILSARAIKSKLTK